MNKMDFANNLFDAIDTIVDKKLKELQFNRCILGHVIQTPDKENNPLYKIQYQDMILFAVPIDDIAEYSVDDLVYVLIPNNDFSNTKFILSRGGNANEYR